MNTILNIFIEDLKGLKKNFLAMVIAVGLCILPSLYAWFNIYSNWDPYANTKNVPIAVASDDAGYEKSDGTYVNMGETVIEQLKENDKLGWCFTDTSEEAIDGVYSGEYYAAIVMGEDFSSSMYDCLANGMEHPKIYYYDNEKKNAIAVKITDTGSATLQSNINTEFINVVVTALSDNINEMYGDDISLVDEIEFKLGKVNDNLISYGVLLDSFVECNTALSETMLDMKGILPKLNSVMTGANNTVNSVNSAKEKVKNGVKTGVNTGIGAAANAANFSIGAKLNSMAVKATVINNAVNVAQTAIAQNDDPSIIAESLKTASENLGSISEDAIYISGQLDTLKGKDSATDAEIEQIKRDLEPVGKSSSNAKDAIEKAREELEKLKGEIGSDKNPNDRNIVDAIDDAVDSIEKIHDEASAEREKTRKEVVGAIDDAKETASKIHEDVQAKRDAEIEIAQKGLEIVDRTSSNLQSAAERTAETAERIHDTAELIQDTNRKILSAAMDEAVGQLPQLNQGIYTALSGKINELAGDAAVKADNAIDKALTSASSTLTVSPADTQTMGTVFDGVSQSLIAANAALVNSKGILDSATGRLTGILDQLESVEESEKYNKLLEILKNDPSLYGEFLSQPVFVEKNPVYETPAYGSAVAPFYTTLAIWVGAIILVSLLKVNAEPKGSFKDANPSQLYLGRLLLFVLLGQVQALLCVYGNLKLLGVQCQDNGLFYLAAMVTSFTFTLLIYTLTISFGDIGKAFAVVIMVIQIAGSSGTYPIELLPGVFQSIYRYFPFPYAINAMREVISGRYENDYWIYMGQLLLFAAAALAVGLVVRKPFMKLNHFLEKRMKDTQMM